MELRHHALVTTPPPPPLIYFLRLSFLYPSTYCISPRIVDIHSYVVNIKEEDNRFCPQNILLPKIDLIFNLPRRASLGGYCLAPNVPSKRYT